MTSVNEVTSYKSKQEAIEKQGKILQRIITAIAEALEDDGPIFFRKIDIKYGLWRILCQSGA